MVYIDQLNKTNEMYLFGLTLISWSGKCNLMKTWCTIICLTFDVEKQFIMCLKFMFLLIIMSQAKVDDEDL